MIDKSQLKPWPHPTYDMKKDCTIESKEDVFVFLDDELVGGADYADQERGIVLGCVFEMHRLLPNEKGEVWCTFTSAIYPGSSVDNEGSTVTWEDMMGKELSEIETLYTMKRGKVEILYVDIPEEDWIKWQPKKESEDCG